VLGGDLVGVRVVEVVVGIGDREQIVSQPREVDVDGGEVDRAEVLSELDELVVKLVVS